MPEAQYTYHFAMQQNTAYIPVDLSYAIGLPPEKAIEYFASKGLKTTLDWQSLWQESHIKAFTIAGAAKLDILQNVKDELDNALHKGIPLQEFKDSLIPRLQALGWLSSSPEKMPYRLENIYRTNMQTAFQAGRYREMMENVKDRPYWQYVAVMDSRTRPAHAALNNKIFRYDDPFWKNFYPPNGFQCRCRVRTFSEKDIEERNLTVESGKDNIVWEEKPIGGGYTKPTAAYIDPKTGEKYFTDAGWSYNPGERFWEKDLRKYDKDIRAAFEKEMAEFMATITQAIGTTVATPVQVFTSADLSPEFSSIKTKTKFRKYADESFADAPDDIKKIVNMVKDNAEYEKGSNWNSSYAQTGRPDRIKIGNDHIRDSRYDTMRHEVGHMVDYRASKIDSSFTGSISQSPTFKNAVKADSDALKADMARRQRIPGEINYAGGTVLGGDIFAGDIFGSLTWNWPTRIGEGHTFSYYLRKPERRESEIFANLFAIFSRTDKTAWNYLVRELPETTKAFEKIIKDLVKI